MLFNKYCPILVTALGLVLALAAPAPAVTAWETTDDQAQSVIVDIRTSSGDVRTVVADRLIPQIHSLEESIKSHYEEASERYLNAKQSGSPNDAIEYEESIATAMTDVMSRLTGICDLENPVYTACDDLRTSLAAGVDEFYRRADDWSSRAEQLTTEVAEIDRSMDSLVTMFADQIGEIETLPLEIDTIVCKLNMARHNLELRRQTAQSTQQLLNRWLSRCESFGSLLDHVRAQYSMVFTAARSQLVLLGEVAEHRRDALNARAVVMELGSLAKEMLLAQDGFDEITNALNGISIMPIDPNDDEAPMDISGFGQSRGLDILTKWKQERGL